MTTAALWVLTSIAVVLVILAVVKATWKPLPIALILYVAALLIGRTP